MSLDGRRVQAVLFDLDGTLIDSRAGIEASVRVALAAVGQSPDRPIDPSWLSAPLAGLIGSLMPEAGPDARQRATTAFMQHYDETGWRSSQPYVGVSQALERLERAGLRSFVVTNKRRAPALAVLDHHMLIDRFEAIYTPDSREPRYASKTEMGRACLEAYQLQPASTLVVGDSRDDLEMARGCGTLFGAASWGYGGVAMLDPDGASRSERAFGPADVTLEAPTDLEMLTRAAREGSSSR